MHCACAFFLCLPVKRSPVKRTVKNSDIYRLTKFKAFSPQKYHKESIIFQKFGRLPINKITYYLAIFDLTVSLIRANGYWCPSFNKPSTTDLSRAFRADSQAVQSPFWAKTKILMALLLGAFWGVSDPVFLLESFLSVEATFLRYNQ